MYVQVWFCNLCEQEFEVSDRERAVVRCTGGHPGGKDGMLAASHWPLAAEYRRTEAVAEERDGMADWEELVLEKGKRFGLEDARKAPDAAAERSARLSRYGWPEGMG